MIILLGGEKGGSGKSCIAQNLAVYLKTKGKDVLLLGHVDKVSHNLQT